MESAGDSPPRLHQHWGRLLRTRRPPRRNFPDLQSLLFVTPAKVGNLDRKRWEKAVRKDHGVELHIIEREEIIALMMMPENASVRASFLYLDGDSEPEVADLIARTRRTATSVTKAWAGKIQGHPLVELTAVRLEPSGRKSADSPVAWADRPIAVAGLPHRSRRARRSRKNDHANSTRPVQAHRWYSFHGRPSRLDIFGPQHSRLHCRNTCILGRRTHGCRPRTLAADGTVSILIERLERNW